MRRLMKSCVKSFLWFQMLGGKFPEYREKMIAYKKGMDEMVLEKAAKMEAEDKA